jgi:hypothetical protein
MTGGARLENLNEGGHAMDREQLEKIEKEALARLRKRHKGKKLELANVHVDEVPSTGGKIFQLAATSADDPAGTRYDLVVNESGEEVDLKALSRSEARAFFGGERRPWLWYRYSYSVKFVCGTQEAADGCCCLPAVRPGSYATEINIHNYHPYQWAWIEKHALPVVFAGMPQGREPRTVGIKASDRLLLPPNSATMDDCCRIGELLYAAAPPAGQPLNVGFLEIVSNVEIKVTAVYTMTNRESSSVSIDVEDVAQRVKYPYYWYPYPWPVEPATAAATSAAKPAGGER